MANQPPEQPDESAHVPSDEPVEHSIAETGDASSTMNEAEAAIDSVERAAAAVQGAAGATAVADGNADGMTLPEFAVETNGSDAAPAGIGLLGDVALRVTIELGRTQMYVEDVLRLNTDSVIELDKAAGDPVEIYVNDRLVARGEVLVLNENFCVRVNEIIETGPQED